MSMSVRGIASGLDVDSIISQLIALERKPITLLQTKQQRLETQQSAWRDVNTRLKSLDSTLSSLKLESTYLAKKASTGDNKVLTASATTQAMAGTYDIVIESLATVPTYTRFSRLAVEDPAKDLAITGSVTIASGDTTWKVDVKSDYSLTEIADAINRTKDADGKAITVRAAVVDKKLVLTSTGKDFTATFTDGPGTVNKFDKILGPRVDGAYTFDSNTPATATKAVIHINGMRVESDTNTVTAIPGVTLNLLAASEGKAIKVNVESDTSVVTKAMQGVVDQYNSVMEFINTKLEKEKGDLRGDSTLMRLQSSLRQMMTSRSSYTQGKYLTLGDIGISTAKWDKDSPDYSGKLTLDTGKLEAALKESSLAIKDILFKQTNMVTQSGVTASGQSSMPGYDAADVVNGVKDSSLWLSGNGWRSLDLSSPRTLTIDLGTSRTLDTVKLFTLNSTENPADRFGVKEYDLYAYFSDNPTERKLVGAVKDNKLGEITHSLGNRKVDKLEFEFKASNDVTPPGFARIVEVEAYSNSGAFHNLDTYLNGFIRSGDGILAEKQKSYTNELDDIKDQIERMEDRLVRREEMLVRQYTALEKALGSMQNQGNWLSSQIGSLPKYNTGE